MWVCSRWVKSNVGLGKDPVHSPQLPVSTRSGVVVSEGEADAPADVALGRAVPVHGAGSGEE